MPIDRSERDAEDLALFAINTGDLYARHKLLAREEASITRWINHVRVHVVAAYYRDVPGERGHSFNPTSLVLAAVELRDHYRRHAADAARCGNPLT